MIKKVKALLCPAWASRVAFCAFIFGAFSIQASNVTKVFGVQLPSQSVLNQEVIFDSQSQSASLRKIPFRGTVSKVDKEKKEIHLKGKGQDRVYQVEAESQLMKGEKAVLLEEIQVGDTVSGSAWMTEVSRVYRLVKLTVKEVQPPSSGLESRN